jgi:AcrR family transcriptional regulator
MTSRAKLSSEERRRAIIQAVRRVFADKGFHGTTTRELADAAGVSEALLFKHFPTKEALFSAMLHSCWKGQDNGKFERLFALEPSASTLVVMVHFLASRILGGCAPAEEQSIHNRLMLRSLAEDGEFARLALGRPAEFWVPKVVECLKAAMAAGEALEGPIHARSAAWFAHHLPVMVLTYLLPARAVIDYELSREELVEQVVWFALRGMGLKEEAIRRHYNPKALALLMG